MKVVVADTSPLNYLVLVGAIHVLPRLYRRVTIPDVVLAELRDESAPQEVAEWAGTPPEWIDVQPTALSDDAALAALDPGEHAAILLAQRHPDVLLLIDDAAGRIEAANRGIPTVGTLGILRAASQQGLVALPSILDRLMSTNFRVSRALLDELGRE